MRNSDAVDRATYVVTPRLPDLRDAADTLIELPVITSFSKIGYISRARLGRWDALRTHDLSGRVIVLTGATSGLGLAAARRFARCGATLVLAGRSAARNDEVVARIVAETGNAQVTQFAADMGDLDQVRALAEYVLARHEQVDVLIHNAGALSAVRTVAPSGIEATVASQVVGPFLLTSLLFDRLVASAPARVITMSSGGMYAAGLTTSRLEMDAGEYNGTQQYARAKRAQVTLNEMWAERFADSGVHFFSMHPGWASTPGVDTSLPVFAKVMRPLLRTPEQGADTLVWLAAEDEPMRTNGGFWLDRRERSLHKLPSTRRTDNAQRRAELWDWVETRASRSHHPTR